MAKDGTRIKHLQLEERAADRKDAAMIRISTFLRQDQMAALLDNRIRTGVPTSEQIRRALDKALGTKKKGGK